MPSLAAAERERTDGLAVFAAAALAASAGVIVALERVGAPDGLVEALGPLCAMVGLAVIGFGNRAASLTDFLAARRSIPSFYLGLGSAAVLGGAILAFASGASHPYDPPWLSIAAGAGIAGLVTAPIIRGGNVSSASDVLATRFPALPTRFAFGLAIFVCALLTAAGGFQLASQSFAAALGNSPRAGVAFTLVALGVTLLPGGLKSSSWADAASGGASLVIITGWAVLTFWWLPTPMAPLSAGLVELTLKTQAMASDPELAIAVSIAFAFYFPLLAPAMAAPSSRQARRAGVNGVALAAFGIAGAAMALPLFAHAPPSAEHTARTLLATATGLPSLALARAGVLAASRSTGVDLARAYSRLTVLSSQRIALQRLTMLLTMALSPFALSELRLTPDRALIVALAVSLGFVAPSLVLALAFRRRGSALMAIVALVSAAGALVVRLQIDPADFAGFGLVNEALAAATVALALGALTALALPSRSAPRRLPPSDPFLDMPFDPAEAR